MRAAISPRRNFFFFAMSGASGSLGEDPTRFMFAKVAATGRQFSRPAKQAVSD